jgi:leader peptidase (prepilin peptidase)/N-methyltransferase
VIINIIILFIYGIVIGSFLNVLIYRIPNNIKMSGRSKCPKCNTQIKWYHNIPVFAWIFLKGKCAYCNNKISIEYPFIELISGLLMLMIGYQYNYEINNYYLWANFIILIGLLTLSAIDYKYKEVPDIISIPLIFVAIFTLSENYDIIESIQRILIVLGGVSLFKYTIELIFNKEMLGEADIIIASIMLGFLKNYNLLYLAIYISAMIILLIYIILKIKNKKMEVYIPLIPYLFIGTLISYIYGNEILKIIYE